MSGPPGAGKTTIARELRGRLGLPLIAKDDLKETLAEALVTAGRVESQRLGVAVFELLGHVMRELLANGTALIVEGNFNRSTLFEGLPDARIVQIHVTAEPETLRRRMLERDTQRHRVHCAREAAGDVAERARAGGWEPLSLSGKLIRIETTVWPDLDAVLPTI